MISLDRAWVVGDRGLILATVDGGRNWIQQKLKVTCSLHAVQFIDERHGWIVGGWIQPFSHRSVGIIFSTNDGGNSWQQVVTPTTGRLVGIQCVGPNHLIAWGDFSPAAQTCLIESTDGGVTWNGRLIPINSVRAAVWENAASAILIDQNGRGYRLQNLTECYPLQGPIAREELLTCAFSTTGWWLAGGKGQCWRSSDTYSWQPVPLPGTEADRESISIHDIKVQGSQIWAVGDPGNVIWHSQDSGGHWQVQPTGRSLPIYQIFGISAERQLAVGAMAQILGTRNGGQAWYPEHSAGNRLAVLNIVHDVSHVAWEPIVFAAWEHRVHVGVGVTSKARTREDDPMFPGQRSQLDQLENDLGIAAIRLQPAPSQYAGQIPAGTTGLLHLPDTVSDNVAETSERWLVSMIRQWRPDVLVIESLAESDSNYARQAMKVRQAAATAARADYRVFSPESLIPDAPWKVSKIVMESKTARASFLYDSNQLLLHSGRQLHELLQPVTLQLTSGQADNNLTLRRTPEPKTTSTKRGYERRFITLESTSGSSNAMSSLLGGINEEAAFRRPIEITQQRSTAQLQGALNIDAKKRLLIEMPGPRFGADTGFDNALRTLTDYTLNESLGTSMLELANAFREREYWYRWQECLQTLIRKAPNDSAAERAALELATFTFSAEARHWRRLNYAAAQMVASKTGTQLASNNIGAAPVSPFSEPQEVRQPTRANFEQPLVNEDITPHIGLRGFSQALRAPIKEADRNSNTTVRWPPAATDPIASATEAIGFAIANCPALQFDPRMRMIMGAQKRSTSFADTPAALASFYTTTAMSPTLTDWYKLAQLESQLSSGHAAPQGEVISVARATAIPQLDGVFDEPFWQIAQPLILPTATNNATHSTAIRFAYDDFCLYLAVRCETQGPALASSTTRTRTRDQCDFTRDYVNLRLDTDRDYATWFRLCVDDQGNATDACCDMLSWDPEWFIQRRIEANAWLLEIAIPFDSLCPQSPRVGQYWAYDFMRSNPVAGVTSNNRADSVSRPPHGMRLLRFESEQSQ